MSEHQATIPGDPGTVAGPLVWHRQERNGGPVTVFADVATLPRVSLMRLLQGGVAHAFGNEIASQVSSYKAANPGATPDEIKAEADALFAEKVTAYVSGEVEKVREAKVPQAKLESLEDVIRRMALGEVMATIAANVAKKAFAAPKKGILVLPNGEEHRIDRDEPGKPLSLVTRHLAKPGVTERLTKDAKAYIAKRDKAAEAAQAGLPDGGGEGIEAFGL